MQTKAKTVSMSQNTTTVEGEQKKSETPIATRTKVESRNNLLIDTTQVDTDTPSLHSGGSVSEARAVVTRRRVLLRDRRRECLTHDRIPLGEIDLKREWVVG